MGLRVSGSQLTNTPGTFVAGTAASLNSAAGYPQVTFVQNFHGGQLPGRHGDGDDELGRVRIGGAGGAYRGDATIGADAILKFLIANPAAGNAGILGTVALPYDRPSRAA